MAVRLPEGRYSLSLLILYFLAMEFFLNVFFFFFFYYIDCWISIGLDLVVGDGILRFIYTVRSKEKALLSLLESPPKREKQTNKKDSSSYHASCITP